MPKRIPQNELDAVQQAVAGSPAGAGIEEISKVLSIRLPRRSRMSTSVFRGLQRTFH